MPNKNSVKVSLSKYSPETIRYAAYAQSGKAYVFISQPGRGVFNVEFGPRPGASPAESHGLVAAFKAELEDEKLRAALLAANKDLRETIVLRALSATQEPPPAPESGLTPEQEKELDDLIAQVESEIKMETAGKTRDPLDITSTWEEKYASGPEKRKKRKPAR